MTSKSKTTRRSFIKNAAAAGLGITIIPRAALGRGFVPPSDRLNVAAVGAGGKGRSDISNTFAHGSVNIAAMCDVDWHRATEMFEKFPKAKRYRDYRDLFDNMKDIDAITVSTPDHNHAIIAHAAMQLGKHVYVQKPLTNTIAETRVLTEAARKHKIVTQMGNQGASSTGTKTMIKWFDEGLIGAVDEVHVWTNRPVWPQGIATPTNKPTMPEGMNWDSWIGPAKYVDYHPLFHPFAWRGWWNFGTGALGDVGCHLIDPPYRVLGLGYPTEVESSVGAVYSENWIPNHFPESCPPSSRTQLSFPASKKNAKAVKMTWTDGGLRPFHPDLIPADHPLGDNVSANGVIMIGEKGIMTSGMYGYTPKIYLNSGEIITMPEEEKDDSKVIMPANGHHHDWVEACKAGYGSKEHGALTSSFDFSGPLTETVLMGNLAIRSYGLRDERPSNRSRKSYNYPGRKKLLWDGEAMKITNFEAANQFVGREYRKGWTL